MKIKRSWYDKIVEVLCIGCLVGMFIYLAVRWNQLPDKIPGHYNLKGEVDRWGSRGELFTMPIMGTVLYVGITILQAFPKNWNTGVTVTEENKERVYRNLGTMISSVKLIMVATFTTLEVFDINGQSLPGFFTPVSLLLIFGVIIVFIVRLYRIK